MIAQDRVTTASGLRTVALSKALQVGGAFLLGIVILYGVGFIQTSAVHNAAHDVRHAAAFPCH